MSLFVDLSVYVVTWVDSRASCVAAAAQSFACRPPGSTADMVRKHACTRHHQVTHANATANANASIGDEGSRLGMWQWQRCVAALPAVAAAAAVVVVLVVVVDRVDIAMSAGVAMMEKVAQPRWA